MCINIYEEKNITFNLNECIFFIKISIHFFFLFTHDLISKHNHLCMSKVKYPDFVLESV